MRIVSTFQTARKSPTAGAVGLPLRHLLELFEKAPRSAMAVVKHFPYQHRTSGDLTQQRRALNLDSLHPAPAPGRDSWSACRKAIAIGQKWLVTILERCPFRQKKESCSMQSRTSGNAASGLSDAPNCHFASDGLYAFALGCRNRCGLKAVPRRRGRRRSCHFILLTTSRM
jgi:hypothetical protein